MIGLRSDTATHARLTVVSPNPKETDPRRDRSAPTVPDGGAAAAEALTKLVQEVTRATSDLPAVERSDFSAGPRIAAPPVETAPRLHGRVRAAGEPNPEPKVDPRLVAKLDSKL